MMRPCACGCGKPVSVKPSEVKAKVYHMACLDRLMAEVRERVNHNKEN